MKAEPADWEERVENVRELLSVAPEGENLAEVLDQVSLYTDMDTQNETRDAVNLSSLHAAKGLEFPVVFMTGMEEGISLTAAVPTARKSWRKNAVSATLA